MKRTLILSLAALAIASLLMVGTSLIDEPVVDDNSPHISLKPPSFIQPAYAQGTPEMFEIGAKLDNEAGISAYTRTTDRIDLDLVRDVFKTIEVERAGYIIGSVPIPNYIEHYDSHVYVHKNGWILAYYPKSDPVAKIIDVKAQTLDTTKLESAIVAIANAAGVINRGINYYDFRYPNATHILFVAEDFANGNDFTITLPSSYGYFEYSWGLLALGFSYFRVDENELLFDYLDDDNGYGTINPSQLLSNRPHTITVEDYGVLAIVYRVR